MKIADKITKYLKDACDKRIKSYYFGDPLVIPVSNLPAIIVGKRQSLINQGATGLDEVDKTYSIKVVLNKKDELGKNPNEVTVQRTIADIVEGIDANGNFAETSIVGVLRKNFTLGNTIENQDMTIEYFLAERGDLITEEAEIIINIKDFVSVLSRS